MISGEPLPREWFAGDARDVAPLLLGKLLVHAGCAARIVEVEAYAGPDDPASHAFRGPTARNRVMFGPPGHLYVYLSYGLHHCANVVCGPEGTASAVLLRAAVPVAGIEAMQRRRPRARRPVDLTNGPGKLCAALAVDGSHNGCDLTAEGPAEGRPPAGPVLRDDGQRPPGRPGRGVRIGISRATDRPWRWWVPDSAYVSR